MTTPALNFNMRSWLFAPGDSERKMEKAASGAADIVLFDLEDAVAEAEKPKARAAVSAFLAAHAERRERLWVRINPLQGPHALTDLAAVMPGRPGGIMLPKSRGRADVELLDHYLSALEVAFGGDPGSTRVAALITETAEGMFTTGTYGGSPRLTALTWAAVHGLVSLRVDRPNFPWPPLDGVIDDTVRRLLVMPGREHGEATPTA